jgi:predicted regulator of Ras-like GTPase activity (Roadblock/LC7/MglB family)
MDEILEELLSTPGIQGSVIVDRDGLVISTAGELESPDALGAEFAEVYKSLENDNRGALKLISLEAANGNYFMSNINDVTFLVVQTGEQINLGRIRYDIGHASGRLKDEL